MKNETKHVMSVTVSTGRPGPNDTPKKPRRKKRAPKKSEVSDPEFGTPSSAKPSHGEPTKPPRTLETPRIAQTDPRREWIEDVVWNSPRQEMSIGNIDREYSAKVQNAVYRREKGRARSAVRRQILTAYRTGLILGCVLGVIIGLGAWWISVLFS